MARAIATDTYVQFAMRYGIPLANNNGRLRSLRALQRAIYRHERRLDASGSMEGPGLYFL